MRNLDKENRPIVRPQQTAPIGALLPFLPGGMCVVIAGPAANFLVEVADKKLGKVGIAFQVGAVALTLTGKRSDMFQKGDWPGEFAALNDIIQNQSADQP